MTTLAPKWVIAKRQQNRRFPGIERREKVSFLYGDSEKELIGMFVVFSVNAIITNHFEMFIRNMNNQHFNKIGSRQGFRDKDIIFMPVVVEGNGITIIMVNTGRGDNRPS